MTNRELLRFLGLAFLFGFGASWPGIAGGLEGAGRPWLGLAMWTPAIAALTCCRSSRASAWAMLKRSGWRTLGYALLAGWSIYALQLVLLAVTGTGVWNSAGFELDPSGARILAIHAGNPVLGAGPQSLPFFALNLTLSLVVSSVLTGCLFAVGEELGWRAVLQPELARRFGWLRGTLLVSVLWAYWHLPVNLAGYNDAAHPVANALFLFPLGVVGASFALAWVTQRSASVWPAAVAHGAGNALAAKLVLTPSSWEAEQATRGVSALLVAAFFGWLLWRREKQQSAP